MIYFLLEGNAAISALKKTGQFKKCPTQKQVFFVQATGGNTDGMDGCG